MPCPRPGHLIYLTFSLGPIFSRAQGSPAATVSVSRASMLAAKEKRQSQKSALSTTPPLIPWASFQGRSKPSFPEGGVCAHHAWGRQLGRSLSLGRTTHSVVPSLSTRRTRERKSASFSVHTLGATAAAPLLRTQMSPRQQQEDQLAGPSTRLPPPATPSAPQQPPKGMHGSLPPSLEPSEEGGSRILL